MAYRLRYDHRFMSLLEALPGDVRGLARQLIRDLTSQPRPGRAKELEDHPGYWRMWLPRNHRLVWKVSDEDQLIDLLYVGPKSQELYDQLGLDKKIQGE
jgi:mRNA-degrading endonuclease RelE of RelBE toxin-antitoxin system